MAEAERSLPQSPALDVAEPEASTERSRARREWRTRIRNVLYPVGIGLDVLVIWEVATRLLEVPAFLFPPPSSIAVSFVTNASLLLFHGWITTAEILLGFVLIIVVGIPLALAIFLWPTFSRSVLPLLVSSQAMP